MKPIARKPEIVRAIMALLCLCMSIWSALPAMTHLPVVAETHVAQERIQDDHGHAHEPELEVYWALHGHAHDAADHDHNPALSVRAGSPAASAPARESVLPATDTVRTAPVFTMERPPRA